jgi:hypothetical protein
MLSYRFLHKRRQTQLLIPYNAEAIAHELQFLCAFCVLFSGTQYDTMRGNCICSANASNSYSSYCFSIKIGFHADFSCYNFNIILKSLSITNSTFAFAKKKRMRAKDPSLANIKSQLLQSIDAPMHLFLNVVNASSFLCNSQKKYLVNQYQNIRSIAFNC